MRATRELLKRKIETFKNDKTNLQPLIGKISDQIKFLQVDVSYYDIFDMFRHVQQLI